jgi:hypothetical protein
MDDLPIRTIASDKGLLPFWASEPNSEVTNDNRGRGWKGVPAESMKSIRRSFLGRRGDLLKDDRAVVGARGYFHSRC